MRWWPSLIASKFCVFYVARLPHCPPRTQKSLLSHPTTRASIALESSNRAYDYRRSLHEVHPSLNEPVGSRTEIWNESGETTDLEASFASTSFSALSSSFPWAKSTHIRPVSNHKHLAQSAIVMICLTTSPQRTLDTLLGLPFRDVRNTGIELISEQCFGPIAFSHSHKAYKSKILPVQ